MGSIEQPSKVEVPEEVDTRSSSSTFQRKPQTSNAVQTHLPDQRFAQTTQLESYSPIQPPTEKGVEHRNPFQIRNSDLDFPFRSSPPIQPSIGESIDKQSSKTDLRHGQPFQINELFRRFDPLRVVCLRKQVVRLETPVVNNVCSIACKNIICFEVLSNSLVL